MIHINDFNIYDYLIKKNFFFLYNIFNAIFSKLVKMYRIVQRLGKHCWNQFSIVNVRVICIINQF